MIGELLATGDEIRSGALIDSNSAYIAEKLEDAGVEIMRHQCVGDAEADIVTVLKEIGGRADIAVVTGGLGPTEDDLTATAAARAAGVSCEFNETAMKEIEAFFKTRQRWMSDSNKKQALLPHGSKLLSNPMGTAPGFSLRIGRCTFFFLPGVPAEMKRMLDDHVLPFILKSSGLDPAVSIKRTITTFGLTEAATGEQLCDLNRHFPEVRLGLRAKFPEIQVKLYAYGKNRSHLTGQVEKAAAWVSDKLGRYIISLTGEPMEVVVGNLLRGRKETVAVAESCTGGLISHRITNVSGSSDYFLFAGVVYSNSAKTDLLGVSRDTLDRFGAVHEETAREMARGVRRITGSTYGLAVTGIAGPSGGSVEKPVGTVCIGIASPDTVIGKTLHFTFGDRLMNKRIFSQSALNMLRLELIRSPI
ncbi:MAG: CinA family nicotinamide mononucleotide deamidase-related protein [Thermodesulfobacteriota bacterium]